MVEIKCSVCAVPLPNALKGGYCRDCHREWRRMRPATTCTKCGGYVPKGRSYRWCNACRGEWRRRHVRRYGRRCACGSIIPHDYRSHRCRECASLQGREARLARGGCRIERRSEARRQQIVALVRSGLLFGEALQKAGVATDTIYSTSYGWKHRHPGWWEAVEAARLYARQQRAGR